MASDPASLDNLRDVVVPPAPAWLPPAVGWLLVATALALAAAIAAARAFARWRADAYRREALRELSALDPGPATPAAAAAVSAILKRAALAAYPRAAVAELAGPDWAAFLDRTGRADAFTKGAGRALWPLAYGAAAPGADMGAIVAAARRWLRRHRADRC